MKLDKRLQNIFDELEAKAYNPTYHNYYYKEANQIIRKHFEALIIDSVLVPNGTFCKCEAPLIRTGNNTNEYCGSCGKDLN